MINKLSVVDAEFLAQLEARENAGLKVGGGDGTSGGVTDDWKESVNMQLKQLHDDVRRLTGWIIAAVSGPLLAIVGLYVFTGQKADTLERRIQEVEVRLDARLRPIEVEQAKINGKLDLLLQRTAPKGRE